MAIAKWLFKVTLHGDHRYREALMVKIQVGNTIPFTKCFATVFKIAQIMSMPHNAQRVGFIITNGNLSLVLKDKGTGVGVN
jgi:hypothetical protein